MRLLSEISGEGVDLFWSNSTQCCKREDLNLGFELFIEVSLKIPLLSETSAEEADVFWSNLASKLQERGNGP